VSGREEKGLGYCWDTPTARLCVHVAAFVPAVPSPTCNRSIWTPEASIQQSLSTPEWSRCDGSSLGLLLPPQRKWVDSLKATTGCARHPGLTASQQVTCWALA
jgi:hypothetical protein